MTDTGRTIQGMVNYDHLAPMETTGVFSTAPGDGNGYNMSVTSQNLSLIHIFRKGAECSVSITGV